MNVFGCGAMKKSREFGMIEVKKYSTFIDTRGIVVDLECHLN